MKIKINAKSVFLYLGFGTALVFLNGAVSGVPLSLGLYFSMLLCGTNLIATPVLYVLASIVHLNWINTVLSVFEAFFFCA